MNPSDREMKDDNLVGMAIGDYFIRRRGEVSKEKVSKKAGLARSTIFNIEKGLPPNMGNLDMLLESYGTTWEEIGREIDKYKREFYEKEP